MVSPFHFCNIIIITQERVRVNNYLFLAKKDTFVFFRSVAAAYWDNFPHFLGKFTIDKAIFGCYNFNSELLFV
jgi:hypothetical protein